jgi:hypothetical protein
MELGYLTGQSNIQYSHVHTMKIKINQPQPSLAVTWADLGKRKKWALSSSGQNSNVYYLRGNNNFSFK